MNLTREELDVLIALVNARLDKVTSYTTPLRDKLVKDTQVLLAKLLAHRMST